jgi:Replication-relaxation
VGLGLLAQMVVLYVTRITADGVHIEQNTYPRACARHDCALMWRNELVRRGLIRILAREEVPTNVATEGELLEATVRGLTMVAGSMGLSLSVAVRHHALASGGPMTAVGTRPALQAKVAHTVGADGVFVTIARSARAQREGALLEWRKATACAWGRMRPDGYGLLRLGRREYGFFVEFDRGTVYPRALTSKFAAYLRYGYAAAPGGPRARMRTMRGATSLVTGRCRQCRSRAKDPFLGKLRSYSAGTKLGTCDHVFLPVLTRKSRHRPTYRSGYVRSRTRRAAALHC